MLELFFPPNYWRTVLGKTRKALRALEKGSTYIGPIYDTTDQPVFSGSRVLMDAKEGTVLVCIYYSIKPLRRIKQALEADGYRVSEPSKLASSRPGWGIEVSLRDPQHQ